VHDIKFYEIVPLDHLIARLAIETPSLTKRLTNLLLASYFPHTKPGIEQGTMIAT
jgi:hypothetical protein